MVLVNLEDLWGETAAQNVPGTTTSERPNWRRKARYSLEQLAAMPQVRTVLRKLNRLRQNR
jgi:4-alpha-glucanotransferase